MRSRVLFAAIVVAILLFAWYRGVRANTENNSDLASLHLVFPIQGAKLSDILDTFHETRPAGRKHEAIDILAARGTPVLAVSDGTIQKLFLSKLGGNTIYEFEPAGAYCFYYAHLDQYAEGLQEGQDVLRGQVIGYVGSTGDANPQIPHLHFAIFKLGPEKQWWRGTPIDPYPILRSLVALNAGGRVQPLVFRRSF